MVGIKSIVIVLVAGAAAFLALRGKSLSIGHLGELTITSAFATGLFAAAATALVLFGARPSAKSRAAIGAKRPWLMIDLPRAYPAVRELPSIVQRALLVGVFACLGLATFTADATARIASVPEDLTKPSRAAYCLPEEPKPKPQVPTPVVAPEPPPVDQAGCALVKRAFKLGYAKTLGNCAPKTATPVVEDKKPEAKKVEVCDRRELDEPFLHYTWRRVVDTAQGASPIDAAQKRVDDISTRVAYLEDLLADIKHSITGTPHASHHIFISVPDPHPKSRLSGLLTGHEPCTSLFEHLPLWPSWSAKTPKGEIIEHVLGQLLFATRFGTPASCSDYTLHWGAPTDACDQIAKDPEGFLGSHDALKPIRAVLDRRRRQSAIRALSAALGHPATLPEPPPAGHVASVACFTVGAPASVNGRSITIDGETLQLRSASTPAIASTIDLYADLARMFAGSAASAAAPTNAKTTTTPEAPLDDAAFSLASLEPFVALDPFTPDVHASIAKPDVAEVYPFDKHLHAFVEGFRRVYFAQRGRL
jgi:hypothetical protein